MPLKSTHLILFSQNLLTINYTIVLYTSSKMPFIWVFVWCQCFSDLMTQARNHTCAPLTTTHSPHHSHHTSQFLTHTKYHSPHTSRFLTPTKYHTWQFFPQLLHQQNCAIQEGHQRNNANKEGAKKGNRTTPKEVLSGNFGRLFPLLFIPDKNRNYTNCIIQFRISGQPGVP